MNKYDVIVVGAGPSSIFMAYEMIQLNKNKKILLIATGALMNSTSTQQGESIPGIAHAIAIENEV